METFPHTEQPLLELSQVTALTDLSATTAGADPSRVYEDLRKRWGNVAPVQMEPGVPAWLVLGYREFLAVARPDGTLFSRDTRHWRLHREGQLPEKAAIWAYTPPIAAKPWSSFHHDGDTRARLRRPLDDALEALPDKAVKDRTEQVCGLLLDRLDGEEGTVDLVREYAAVVGFGAMAALFGFDPDTAEQMRQDSAVIMQEYGPQTAEARTRMGQALMGHVASRQAEAAVDLTSEFVRHPSFLNGREIADSMTVPLIAAAEFLTAWIALTLRLVLADQRFSARWRGGRLDLDQALDEVLWRDTPVPNSCLPRFATQDTVLGGMQIRKGDALVLAMAGANHDPQFFAGDLEVGNRSHLAWGTGPHACPARSQARLITRTAVERIRQELTLSLAVPVEQIQWAHTPWVRRPQALPVHYRREATRGHEL
ncbi:cytochrome P450 [Promicromonospora sp. MS192]|uniref:cytochrome P450 n=1 Tax=Promicromonospora sp. MS192 TaxID=3412684 RepID=UPI003C2FF546